MVHRDVSAQSVTSAAESAEVDRSRRRKQYLITMGIRTACFILAILVDGPLRWVFVTAAVFLPFFAVVAANAVAPRLRGRVRPVNPSLQYTPELTPRAHRDETAPGSTPQDH